MYEISVKRDFESIIKKIEEKDYFKFPKLLHGFWERIDYLSNGSNDLEIVKKNIKEIGNNFGRKIYKTPPRYSDFFKPCSDLGVGEHYLEIINLLQNPKSNILWGISEKPFNIENKKINNFKVNEKSLFWIKEIVKAPYIDGCFWKDITSLNLMQKFLLCIKDFEVIVIGMDHLKNINKYLKLKNFHFVKVAMPLALKAKEFQTALENFHKKINKPAIYLSQMSIDGITIICNSDLKDSFFFDMGRSLDIFGEKNFEYVWEKTLSENLKFGKRLIKFL